MLWRTSSGSSARNGGATGSDAADAERIWMIPLDERTLIQTPQSKRHKSSSPAHAHDIGESSKGHDTAKGSTEKLSK
jgi:hypothetical protein